PDGTARGLVGRIISRFEGAGFSIVALRHTTLTRELARQFYAEHEGKPFFEPLIEFMTSGPVALLGLEREQAIERARQLCGKTNPLEASPGTIRADHGLDGRHNTVHASDSPASARRELALVLPEALEG
ncbi:MAG: nucleoside-diphosphate kinase, partial [Armatimonadetes bacterium]|nr:nucleoside-diphosphate kinase [Armatimonadota bacterium]